MRLLAIDESSEQETYISQKLKISSGLLAQDLANSEQANAANSKSLTCYNCGKTGHFAPQRPKLKHHQANQASTGCQRGEREGKSRGRDYKNGPDKTRGKHQQDNVSQSQPETVVHGCSAWVVNLSLTSEDFTSHSALPSPLSLWANRVRTRYLLHVKKIPGKLILLIHFSSCGA